MAEMAVPIGGGDLVADQLVDGLGVRDAQQRLGEAHQRDAFGRGQRVFVQEGVEPALAEPFAAYSVDEPARRGGDALARFEGHVGGGEDARIRFDVRYYLVAILFIIFDLEVAFLFPWAVSLGDIGMFGFWSMIVFLAVLTIGFIYEWKKGALEWE